MPTPVETILTSIGIPAEDITKITTLSEEEQKTFDAKPYAEKVKSNYQTQFKNDPEFFSGITLENLPPDVKKKIESSQFGRAAKIATEKLLKGLGMTEAEFEDLPAEQKEKIESFIPAIAERYTKTKTGDKQVQQDLINARKELEKFGPDYEKGVEAKYQTQAEQKVTAAIFNANLIGELSTIPGLKIKPSTLAREANEILNSQYAFERVGDYSVELRNKQNPTMKVLKENSSKELTLKDALLDIAIKEGWVDDNKADDKKGGGTVPIVPGKSGLTMVAPHIADKISQKIAEEAKS